MNEAGRFELDEDVGRLCGVGDYQGAATSIIKGLGADVVRVLFARFRDEQATAEVFSRFAEDLWLGLPAFSFRCSVRAWVFTLARNAGSRYLQREAKRWRAGVPLSQVPELSDSVRALRTGTLAHLRTENRDRVARLRDELEEDDQMLLTLRIDRELTFREIAVVTLGDADAAEDALKREAARLRKRLQAVKDKLRRRIASLGEK